MGPWVYKRWERCLGGVTIVFNHVGQHLTYCMDRLDRYIDHRICEILPSNLTVETPAATTYFKVACLDSKISHIVNILQRIEGVFR